MSLTHFFSEQNDADQYIDHAFRLNKWESLLNLDFYFVNAKVIGNLLKKKNSLGRSFMIVKLPQQHIAESAFDTGAIEFDVNWKAVTCISGYSYIVFRIFFQNDESKNKFEISEKIFLDWNNDELFNLQVFETDLESDIFHESYNNTYPFQYTESKKIEGTEEKVVFEHDLNKVPKDSIGDPKTIIEVPARLFISPRTPDFRDGKGEKVKLNYEWIFSGNDSQMWMATLSLERISSTQEFDNNLKLELLLVGSPDYPTPDQNSDNKFTQDDSGNTLPYAKVLPKAKDRKDLVELYIKHKLVAKTNKIVFSQLGVSTFIEFKNSKIKDTLPEIDLLSWEQLISFGRDEEVTLINLIVDKQTGAKMVRIRTEKRRTRSGVSYKDYREYVMPLDEYVDYQTHQSTLSGAVGFASDERNKFQCPFKRIDFIDKTPKRILPLGDDRYINGNKAKKFDGINEPLFYYPQTIDGDYLTFEFEGTDWHDKKIRFTKKIQAISYQVNEIENTTTKIIEEANNFFDVLKKAENKISIFRKKIGYAVGEKINGVIENVESDLETASLLLNGQLKDLGGNKIDFFNEYTSIPALEEAEVFIDSVGKLVGKELPVKINYAEDYLSNQIKDKLNAGINNLQELIVEGNEAKVFAKIFDESKKEIQGAMQNIAKDLGGFINPELPVDLLTYLKDPHETPTELLEGIGNVIDSIQAKKSLLMISEDIRNEWKAFKKISPRSYFKELEGELKKATILGDILLSDVLQLDFTTPRIVQLPDKVVYNFVTNTLKDLDVEIFRFNGQDAELQIYFEKNLKNLSEFYSFSRLAKFSVDIKIFSSKVLSIYFNEFKVTSSDKQPRKTEVKINKVDFGGNLKFLAELAKNIKMPGAGLRILPSLNKIDIGYTFQFPSISSPSFNFTNLKFDVGLNIPFPGSSIEPSPITTSFSINKPDDKFLISVGIFGGRGHFVLESSTKELRKVQASLEFGGYFGINLGIARGYAFLFAGIQFTYLKDQGIQIDAYLICGGGVTVFGFISVYVTFIMQLTYKSEGDYLEGYAAVSYSIKIGFFKKSFTLSYRKRFAGTSSGTAGLVGFDSENTNYKVNTIYSPKQWKNYCNSFSY